MSLAPERLLGYERSQSSPTSNLTAKHHARLGVLSQSTQRLFFKNPEADDMIDKFNNLLHLIEVKYPQCPVRLTAFPSGAAMLDITIGTEVYILEYGHKVGIGISRMSKATFGWEGYEKAFERFEDAQTYVVSLIESNNN